MCEDCLLVVQLQGDHRGNGADCPALLFVPRAEARRSTRPDQDAIEHSVQGQTVPRRAVRATCGAPPVDDVEDSVGRHPDRRAGRDLDLDLVERPIEIETDVRGGRSEAQPQVVEGTVDGEARHRGRGEIQPRRRERQVEVERDRQAGRDTEFAAQIGRASCRERV